jgi:phi13 family phage major tail protein
MEVASTLGNVEVEIQKNELTTQNKADLLGHTIDTNGVLVYGDSDVAPWVAIAFRTLKSNGKYRYVWLYKGKFSEPEDNNETKGDSINFQSATINGQFARLNYAYDIDGKKVRPWKYELDADAENANENAIAGWFKAPVMPGATVTP